MKNKFSAAMAVILMLSLALCFFSGCSKNKNDDLTVTDPDGITYLAIENQDGEIMAGVTDADGNLYAAEIDEDGNVLKDGDLYVVDSYTGTLPYNNTTAVAIEQTEENTHNFAQGTPVTDPNASTTVIKLDDKDEGKTTSSKDDKTTKPSSEDDKNDKDNLLAEDYKKLFASGSYYIEFSTEDEEMSAPITAAVKNGNIYMKTTLEGMNCNMIYQKEKDSVYVVLTDYHVYCKMPSEMMNDLQMASFGQTEEVKDVTVYEASIDGRDCICEAYETKTGDIANYYFYNGDLVRIDQIGADGTVSIMNVIKISSTVDDELFELPKTYVPINLSKLGMEETSEE